MVQEEVCNSKEVLEVSLSFQDYFIRQDKSGVYFYPKLWNTIFTDPDEILSFLMCVGGRGEFMSLLLLFNCICIYMLKWAIPLWIYLKIKPFHW